MSDEFKKIESLLEDAKEYVNTRIAQAKLSVAEKVSKLIARIIAGLIAGLVFIFFLLFISIASAIAIGQALNNSWLGFLIIGATYFLLGIIIWKAKDRLLRIPLMNAIINSLFSHDKKHEED